MWRCLDYRGGRDGRKGKGQGKMVYENPNGFEGLGRGEEEEDEEEEEDKPPTMVDSSEDEQVEVHVEKEDEESDEEDDKLFNFCGNFRILTWEATPVPEPYQEEPHSCPWRKGCCGGLQAVRSGRNRRNKRYRKIETPNGWYKEKGGTTSLEMEADEWDGEDMEWDQE